MRFAAALAVLAVVGCDGHSDGTAQRAAPEPRVGATGVTVRLPSGWSTTAPRDGNVIDPLTRVAISSQPIAERTDDCHTQIANYAPRPTAVTLVLVEWKPAPDVSHPPRPIRFTRAGMPLLPRSLECFDGPSAAAFFEDRGRIFGAYLMLGERAPPALAAQARSVLDTLVVENLPRGTSGRKP